MQLNEWIRPSPSFIRATRRILRDVKFLTRLSSLKLLSLLETRLFADFSPEGVESL